MFMALHYASIPLHSFLNSKAIFLKNTHQLRFSESPKTQTRSQLKTMMATCSLHPMPLYTSSAINNIEAITANFPQTLQTFVSTYTQELLIADLDPTTAKTAIAITGPFLSALGFLFIIRIVMSWYPKLPVGKFPYIVAYAPTEPILKVTRKLIPPLGGVDVTPVVWFALVSFLNEILVGPQGLLVLLSQQIQS